MLDFIWHQFIVITKYDIETEIRKLMTSMGLFLEDDNKQLSYVKLGQIHYDNEAPVRRRELAPM